MIKGPLAVLNTRIVDVFDKVPTIKNRLWRYMALSIDITQA